MKNTLTKLAKISNEDEKVRNYLLHLTKEEGKKEF